MEVRAGGHGLQVRQIGSWGAADPVLVFLHEGLGSISMWRDFPDLLAEACGLPALVYDRYGHGGSDPVMLPRPGNFLDLEAERTLPELLAACGIGRPVLVGHSDGGTIALLYAGAFPDRPVACITEAAHVLFEEKTRAGVAAVSERWQTDADFRRRLSRHHGDGTEAMVRGWAEAWLGEENRGWSMLDRLATIRCPVLAIQGAVDEHGTPFQLEQIAARVSGPVETAMLPDCGHVPHHEARPEVFNLMRDFIVGVIDKSGGE